MHRRHFSGAGGNRNANGGGGSGSGSFSAKSNNRRRNRSRGRHSSYRRSGDGGGSRNDSDRSPSYYSDSENRSGGSGSESDGDGSDNSISSNSYERRRHRSRGRSSRYNDHDGKPSPSPSPARDIPPASLAQKSNANSASSSGVARGNDPANSADNAYEAGRYGEAVKLYATTLRDHLFHAQAQWWMYRAARCLMKLGDDIPERKLKPSVKGTPAAAAEAASIEVLLTTNATGNNPLSGVTSLKDWPHYVYLHRRAILYLNQAITGGGNAGSASAAGSAKPVVSFIYHDAYYQRARCHGRIEDYAAAAADCLSALGRDKSRAHEGAPALDSRSRGDCESVLEWCQKQAAAAAKPAANGSASAAAASVASAASAAGMVGKKRKGDESLWSCLWLIGYRVCRPKRGIGLCLIRSGFGKCCLCAGHRA